MLSMSCILLSSGKALHRHAAIPATIGVENEVPLAYVISPLVALMIAASEPNAQMSGLVRRSAAGPYELNVLCSPKRVTEPTVRIIIYDMNKTVKVDIVDDYNCTIVGTGQGYIKKIIRYSDNQKTKDGDTIIMTQQTTNKADLLVFTNKANMYTVKISSLEESVPSSLGQYLPSMINFEPDEEVLCYVTTDDYSGNIPTCYENGKVARIQLSAYKNNLKKTT